jgi:hypothetical protein
MAVLMIDLHEGILREFADRQSWCPIDYAAVELGSREYDTSVSHKATAADRKLYTRLRKAAGKCQRCAQPTDGRARCESCSRLRQRARSRGVTISRLKRSDTYKKAVRAAKQPGECLWCKQPAEEGRKLCAYHREYHRLSAQKAREAKRNELANRVV